MSQNEEWCNVSRIWSSLQLDTAERLRNHLPRHSRLRLRPRLFNVFVLLERPNANLTFTPRPARLVL
jgi:hypothetical protein